MIYNLTYTKEPSPETDAAWDSMFPSKHFAVNLQPYVVLTSGAEGVDFVKHPTVSPNLSGLAVFHELHCVVCNPKTPPSCYTYP